MTGLFQLCSCANVPKNCSSIWKSYIISFSFLINLLSLAIPTILFWTKGTQCNHDGPKVLKFSAQLSNNKVIWSSHDESSWLSITDIRKAKLRVVVTRSLVVVMDAISESLDRSGKGNCQASGLVGQQVYWSRKWVPWGQRGCSTGEIEEKKSLGWV